MTLEPFTSDDDQNDARPASMQAGAKLERPAGRRPPPAAPVIALRMESLLTWTAERVGKFPAAAAHLRWRQPQGVGAPKGWVPGT